MKARICFYLTVFLLLGCYKKYPEDSGPSSQSPRTRLASHHWQLTQLLVNGQDSTEQAKKFSSHPCGLTFQDQGSSGRYFLCNGVEFHMTFSFLRNRNVEVDGGPILVFPGVAQSMELTILNLTKTTFKFEVIHPQLGTTYTYIYS